ncbi:MAG TPA: hypothetical protein EYO85_05915, partial [Rhodospirillales bacterium]|nr:hypothetical protein [Rhodospirillales bacterium]
MPARLSGRPFLVPPAQGRLLARHCGFSWQASEIVLRVRQSGEFLCVLLLAADEEHHVIIPMTVLEELDKLKSGKSSTAAD